MQDEHERRKAFEHRLSELKARMEAGLVSRAEALRDAIRKLSAGDQSARKLLKTESHKLRGIAGSYGYDGLSELAGELEKRASISVIPHVVDLATRLAEMAEEVSQGSKSSPPNADLTPVNRPIGLPGGVRPRRQSSQKIIAQRATLVGLGAHGGALRVLAMDDDAPTLKLLGLTLREVGGFEAVVVTEAREALEHMRLREFDVVISDAMMPDMNGQEFCQAARALGGYAARVPIIILSAATCDELDWRSGLPGPVIWLRKPFMPSELVNDIARVVKAHPLDPK
jgi:CheY-like chemotaxis protein/HPt (histidine-containing phosphotransfer) domain-containing protein